MRIINKLVLCLFLFFSFNGGMVLAGEQQAVIVRNGFYTGNDYINLDMSSKIQYITGVIDGMLCYPLFCGKNYEPGWFGKFISGKTNQQLVAIIDKFIKANPERWHEPMHTLTYNALIKASKK